MPIYEFECGGCGERFEQLLPIGSGFDCPTCKTPAQKLFSRFAVKDDTPNTEQRANTLLRFGRDPSSLSEIRRMERMTGKLVPESRAGFESPKEEKKPFHLTEDQKREAVAMVRHNRAEGSRDNWRMPYTTDPAVIKAAETAAKEIAKK